MAADILSDTTFAIRWTIDGEPGLIIYQVGADGIMNGLWAVRGRTGNGGERLTPAD